MMKTDYEDEFIQMAVLADLILEYGEKYFDETDWMRSEFPKIFLQRYAALSEEHLKTPLDAETITERLKEKSERKRQTAYILQMVHEGILPISYLFDDMPHIYRSGKL